MFPPQFSIMIITVTVYRTYLGSWGADVFHALDAADAAVGDFSTGQADVVPVTPLTIKPAAGALKESVTRISLEAFSMMTCWT